jgi:hypothetical protein
MRLKAERWPQHRGVHDHDDRLDKSNGDSDRESHDACDDQCDCDFNKSCHVPLDSRNFFSLAQVCRQIRTEFLSVYKERTQTGVDPYDLDEGYIPTLLAPPCVKDEDVIGNLVIVIFEMNEASYYDITPIIRLAQQAKRLRVTITYSKAFLSSAASS